MTDMVTFSDIDTGGDISDLLIRGRPVIEAFDCSDVKERDDGIVISPLDAATETYRYDVYVADVTKLHGNNTTYDRAFGLTESLYPAPDDHTKYSPMLDKDTTKKRHFEEGTTREAMRISFTASVGLPIFDIDIDYLPVHVGGTYGFDQLAGTSERMEMYRSASSVLQGSIISAASQQHAEVTLENRIADTSERLQGKGFGVGSTVVMLAMVGAGHAVSKVFEEEERLGLWRVHDPTKNTNDWILNSRHAYFDTKPGLHAGLGMDGYIRVGSPLRRLEDFVMQRLIWLRHVDKPVNDFEASRVYASQQRLNQKIAADAFRNHGNLVNAATLRAEV